MTTVLLRDNDGVMMNEPDSVKITELKLARAESWKPFAIALLVVVVIAALAAVLAREHIGIAANLMFSLLCLLPLVILMAPLVVGVVLGNWALGRADQIAVKQLFGLEQRAADINEKAREGSRAVGEKFIGIAAAVERLAPLWDIFDVREPKDSDNVAHPQSPDQSVS
jgi:hypothetical protein